MKIGQLLFPKCPVILECRNALFRCRHPILLSGVFEDSDEPFELHKQEFPHQLNNCQLFMTTLFHKVSWLFSEIG
jgi:hypothetical protein